MLGAAKAQCAVNEHGTCQTTLPVSLASRASGGLLSLCSVALVVAANRRRGPAGARDGTTIAVRSPSSKTPRLAQSHPVDRRIPRGETASTTIWSHQHAADRSHRPENAERHRPSPLVC